jgi:RNA-directed DNA polymerase
MGDKRQKIQLRLAFGEERRSEAPKGLGEGTETPTAKRMIESPASNNERLMEEVCERENCLQAYKRVKSNRGSAGIDGMTVEELPGYLKEHWPAIREQLLNGTYKPRAVRRVEIPKPDGGVRQLGIPTVLDRMVQQAVMQVLQGRWDAEFSEHSHGFRPGRSAHQAVAKAQRYVTEGRRWVVDLDLEKFFDRVNHDKLMAAVARRVRDKRMLKLIRAFLTAGVMENGLVGPVDEGTPQGGPLSPLLSNLVLDELDRELERREHCFVRYADDCNIYVRSRRAGERVKRSITVFITRRLKLKVNESKSAVARPADRKFLGFSLTRARQPKRRIAAKALLRFRRKVRELTGRTRGISIEQMTKELSGYLRGWKSYFGFSETPTVFQALDKWVRHRLRSVIWKQWKRGRLRFQRLCARGVGTALAAQTAGSSHGPWRVADSPAMHYAFSVAYFDSLGLPRLFDGISSINPNRRMRTRLSGGVGGESR